jgi:pyruvate dehydrogenase E2 component (dihydrolipoamide acetyltransferase)
MPALGMAQETGRVLNWLKNEGEQVSQGEMLLEIETDKATFELEALASGVLQDISAWAGDDVPVGTVIAKIRSSDETVAPETTAVQPKDDAVQQVASSAETQEIEPTAPQFVSETTSSRATETAAVTNSFAADSLAQPEPSAPAHAGGRVPSSPKARRLAAEKGIDIRTLAGTGPGRAVRTADVLSAKAAPAARAEQLPATSSTVWRIMAERTTEAWKTIPHFYLVRDVDASSLVSWRQAIRAQSADEIRYTDLLTSIVAKCLGAHPNLNSEASGGNVSAKKEINVGLAMAVDQGLVVPVIRNADKLTVSEIAASRRQLSSRAQAGKLKLDDLSTGTFTISNLGMYGVDSFHAIVNPPQAAILAVGRIASRVVAVDGQPAVRPIMTLTLSCDHRAVDGARAARFLQDLVQRLETAPGA